MIKPAKLNRGDTIGIVAPASDIKRERLTAGVAELERLGFRTKYSSSIFEKSRYTAGNDERRAEELQTMLLDPKVKAIIAARGGYGSVRILDLLSGAQLAEHPKILMGYSDITTLLIYFQRVLGWVTFHGPMVTREFADGNGHYVLDWLERVIMNSQAAGKVSLEKTEVIRGGTARGMLTGGCLPMLVASLGTPYEFSSEGTVLFLEDYASKPYQVDRMLVQLLHAGKFEGVRAVLFGEMTGCQQHPEQGYTILEVIEDCMKPVQVPMLFGVRSGHSDWGNLVLPLGVDVSIDCDRRELVVEEAAVE
ncbi:MAG: LD-carboxypeptidase [Acidobacteria bacterium]|nr:LD-carboxypeptidase [Acidobacteriota bacterium]